MKKQYELNKNVLELRVQKAPLFVRSIFFFFTFLFFLLPLTGIFLGLMMGKGFHIGYFIGLFFFGILGFYMLPISLWNTNGKETIKFENNKITYLADYGWFTDGKRQKELKKPLVFSIRQIGYEEDNRGVLVIGSEEPIVCATKMPNADLKKLIHKLKILINNY